MSEQFVHLHNHSEYSLLDGMLRITDLDGKPSAFLKSAYQKGVRSLAITDHGNMYGAVDFYNNARAVGIKPILGCELYITAGPRTEKSKDSKYEYGHLTALVENQKGYENLVEMLSLANTEGFYRHPRIDFELLEKYREGIIFLSGCLKSLVAYNCSRGELEKAVSYAGRFKDILGPENFYIELMDHGIEEEKAAIKGLVEVAAKTGLKMVATNDCHYEKKEDWFAHDVHICISTNSQLDDPNRLKMNTHELYFKSSDEMIKLFSWLPESISNTVAIAERCLVEIKKDKIYLPDFKVPEVYYQKASGEREAQFLYLKDLCYSNLEKKLKNFDEKYKERLEFELGVINKMVFSSYFLIVMDFIKYARENGVPVGPGRGSGAGALVAYALDITRVDPLEHDLLFERFLNPERASMPDLDIDFSDTGREKVIDYVKKKYGVSNVANIITYGSIMAKTAVKDVGRVMGMPAADTNNITKLIPNNYTLNQALEENEELKKLRQQEKYAKLFEVALKIEGLRRHTGVHAAGVLITARPVMKYVPLAVRDEIVTTQYDGNVLTELGLLKVDFLGLRTLSVIDEAERAVREKNPDFDINKIPFDDKKTFELLCRGETTGVFQLESEGMRRLVKNLKPSVFPDISALVALYRPGPLQSGMVEHFVNRKHGKEKIVYDHPMLEPILRDTYGNIVYQEQVMEIAKKLAGFTPGEADKLRKAMGKKIMDVMEKEREHFLKGCAARDIPKKTADKIFNAMIEFAKYGFNKSHSVAYATVSYQTAYLKANYPVEFMAALLTSEIGHNAMNTSAENKIVTYIEEAGSMGIKVLPLDVNKSFPKFKIEGGDIRFALMAVKNIGEGVAEEIVSEREKNGPYKSSADFISRNNSKQFNKRVLESLAKGGALDSLYPQEEKTEVKRACALEDMAGGTDRLMENFSQGSLFQTAQKKKLSEHEILKNEKEVLGFYYSSHPLASLKKYVKMVSRHTIADAASQPSYQDSMVRVSGVINQIKPLKTKKNEQMCKFVLEDLTGEIWVFVSSRKLNEASKFIKPDSMVTVTGKVKAGYKPEDPQEITLEDICDLECSLARYGKSLIIFLDGKAVMGEEEKDLKPLVKTLEKHAGGSPVFFRVDSINREKYLLETDFRVNFTHELFRDLDACVGGNSWQIESA